MRRSTANAAASQRCGDLGRGLGIDGPRVEQVQVAVARRRRLRHVVGIRQTGGGIFGGEARDVVGGPHRLLERRAREVGRARIAAPLPDVDGDADRLVAVALDVLDLALAHRYRQADSLRDLGRRVAGA